MVVARLLKTGLISLAIFCSFVFFGCPMDVFYVKLVASNNSDKEMVVAAKDSSNNLLSYTVVAPGRKSSLGSRSADILQKQTDSLNIYWVDNQAYNERNGGEEFNDSTCSKHAVYTRQQLDDADWVVYYP